MYNIPFIIRLSDLQSITAVDPLCITCQTFVMSSSMEGVNYFKAPGKSMSNTGYVGKYENNFKQTVIHKKYPILKQTVSDFV